jgi:hypothetical protein
VLLNNHPVATKAVTSALLTLFGDIVGQVIGNVLLINFPRLTF